MELKLKKERCNDEDDYVWKSKLSDLQISDKNPGDYKMGDVGQLGWAVLKNFQHEGEDLVDFVHEKRVIEDDFIKTKNKWHNIQPHVKNLQFG